MRLGERVDQLCVGDGIAIREHDVNGHGGGVSGLNTIESGGQRAPQSGGTVLEDGGFVDREDDRGRLPGLRGFEAEEEIVGVFIELLAEGSPTDGDAKHGRCEDQKRQDQISGVILDWQSGNKEREIGVNSKYSV